MKISSESLYSKKGNKKKKINSFEGKKEVKEAVGLLLVLADNEKKHCPARS